MVAPNPMMTAAELAETFGVKPATVRAWARDGLIPVVAPTRRTLRFDPEAVARRLSERSAGTVIRPAETAHKPANMLD